MSTGGAPNDRLRSPRSVGCVSLQFPGRGSNGCGPERARYPWAVFVISGTPARSLRLIPESRALEVAGDPPFPIRRTLEGLPVRAHAGSARPVAVELRSSRARDGGTS